MNIDISGIDSANSLPEVFFRTTGQYAASPAQWRREHGEYRPVTYAQLATRIRNVAAGLMNAGVKTYEIFNILDAIKINKKWILATDIEHGYRFAHLNGVATQAKFKIVKGFDSQLLDDLLNLRSNQPHEPSAGSAFKNPENDYAGRLIEEVGLKGLRKGDMQWSNVHANFLVNQGNGTFEDAKFLIDLVKEKVLKECDVTLIEEIKIL